MKICNREIIGWYNEKMYRIFKKLEIIRINVIWVQGHINITNNIIRMLNLYTQINNWYLIWHNDAD